MATIQDFILRFRTEGSEKIKQVSGTINDLRDDLESFGEIGGPLSNTINGIVGRLGPLGLAASVAGVAFVGLGAKALQLAGDLSDIAGATGIAASQLSSLKNSIIDAGGKAEDFGQIATKLNQSVQEAASGNENLQKAFKNLGVFVTDSTGKVRNTGDILQDITQKFQRGELTASQYSAAIDILGKNINKLELQKLSAAADPEFDKRIEELDRYNTAIDKLNEFVSKTLIKTFGELAIAINKAFDLDNALAQREAAANKEGFTYRKGGPLDQDTQNKVDRFGRIFGRPEPDPNRESFSNKIPGYLKYSDQMRKMTEEEMAAYKKREEEAAAHSKKMAEQRAAAAGSSTGMKPGEQGGFGATPEATINAIKQSEKRAADARAEAAKQGQLKANQERLDALLMFADKSQAAELKLDAQIREININRDADLAKARREINEQERLTQKQKDAEYAAVRKDIMAKAELDIVKARSRSAEEVTREAERIQSLITQSKARVEEEQRINDLLEEKLFFNISNADATDRERERAQQLLDIENERARVLSQIKQIKDLPPEEIARREKEINAVFDERRRITENQQRIDQEQQASFSKGFQKAFREYSESARNNFNTAQRIFERATQGMEDAIVDFAKTGKFEFKDFLNTVLEELLRSQIRQLIAQTFGGMPGGGSITGGLIGGVGKLLGFANGGIIPTNGPVLVGERGPEIISGAAGRVVTPNEQLGGGTFVTYNINAVDAMSFKQMLARDPIFLYAVAEQGRRRLPGGRV